MEMATLKRSPMSALGQDRSFNPGQPNGRFAPKAVIHATPHRTEITGIVRRYSTRKVLWTTLPSGVSAPMLHSALPCSKVTR
jgi:hypothetical protein